jgi:DNA replication protein DnaC
VPVENQQVGIKAWAFWLRNRDKLLVKFPMTTFEWHKSYPNRDDCPICHGALEVRAVNKVVYQCMCLMMNWRDRQLEARSQYQSRFDDVDLDDLELCKGDEHSYQLKNAVDAARHFINHLDGWLVLSGPSGAGKSHILKSIATAIKPIGLYITATDFERKVFESMRDDTLDSFVLAISQAPVLLFDDLGAEYGKDFVKAQLTSVFIARDNQAKDLPTIVTTNLDRPQIKQIPRVGSRLLNQDVAKFLPLNLMDYRSRDYDRAHSDRSNIILP